jgi:hypothetical protein
MVSGALSARRRFGGQDVDERACCLLDLFAFISKPVEGVAHLIHNTARSVLFSGIIVALPPWMSLLHMSRDRSSRQHATALWTAKVYTHLPIPKSLTTSCIVVRAAVAPMEVLRGDLGFRSGANRADLLTEMRATRASLWVSMRE